MEFKEILTYVEENKGDYYKKMHMEHAVSAIKRAGDIVVLTGAGISTESGLPDFRSNGGLWDGHKPEEISHWSKIGTPEFREFFTKRIIDIQEHKPNIAHEILAKWQTEKKLTIITQNIDGYHQVAGAKNVIELHGHLRHLQCTECESVYDFSEYTMFKDDECGYCDGIIRPPVVLFGEDLPALPWFQAVQAMKTADLVIVLGTSLQVYPFNTLIDEARNNEHGATLMIVTKSSTPYDGLAYIRIHDGIGETLSTIDNLLSANQS